MSITVEFKKEVVVDQGGVTISATLDKNKAKEIRLSTAGVNLSLGNLNKAKLVSIKLAFKQLVSEMENITPDNLADLVTE